MKNVKAQFSLPARSPMNLLTATALFVWLVASITTVAHAQVTVFVPGTTSGDFGIPISVLHPFVPALVVQGPGTIQIDYVSGTVNFGAGDTGPNGAPWDLGPVQTPLQEAKGVARGHVNNLAALIGVFVPQARVNAPGFQAIDGTKDLAPAGIVPSKLFFIGTSKTIHVNGPGTLFLGINDEGIDDNSGGFTVAVSGP